MSNNSHNDNFIEILAANIGRVVTVFTESGGATGCGFTGLLVKVDCDFIKLVTELPCAPSHPFGLDRNRNSGRNRCCGNEFGTTVIIPVDAIVSFVFNEL